jgi:hypothetical protein
MQESRYDGSDVFTSNPTKEQIDEAITNPANKTVSIHAVGSVIEMRDGTQYIVCENGSWRKRSAAERILAKYAEFSPEKIQALSKDKNK